MPGRRSRTRPAGSGTLGGLALTRPTGSGTLGALALTRPAGSGTLGALALALTLMLAAGPVASRAEARGASKQRIEHRCTPKGIQALRGTARAERKVRCLINRRRARGGAPPLRYNRCLDRAAERHARDMVRRRYFAHSSHGGGTPAQRARAAGYATRAGYWMVAENLGWGLGRSAEPRRMVRAWMRSAGHRANILQARYRDVGVAVVRGAPIRARGRTRGARATYVVEFGARQRGGRCGQRTARTRHTRPAGTRQAARRQAHRRAAGRRRAGRRSTGAGRSGAHRRAKR